MALRSGLEEERSRGGDCRQERLTGRKFDPTASHSEASAFVGERTVGALPG
jgi:hypothetical protein